MNVNADDASLDLAEITGNAYRSRHDSIEDEYEADDDEYEYGADGWSGNRGRSFIKF